MKNTASQKLRLGIFIVVGTLLLVAALYFIGNRQNLFGSNVKLNAQFSNVNGLKIGNNVRYSGIDVGTVSRIKMQNDTLILVEMLIKQSIQPYIKKDAIATISSDGLVGNMIINIIPREGRRAIIVSGDTISTYSRIGTDDMMTTLNVTNQNAALLTADLLEITTEIIEGKGTLGMLITDSTMAGDLKQTIFQLRKVSTEASKSITELNNYITSIKETESVANVLLLDSISGQKMKAVVGNLEQSSIEINKISASFATLMGTIEQGDGALKYLTSDEALVKNIDSVMTNVKESTQKFNESMDALKNNFLLRGYFRKLERQAKKAKQKKPSK